MEFLTALSSGNFAQAIALVNQHLDGEACRECAAPNYLALVYMNRGYCNYKLQLYRKALKDYDQALQLQPTCMGALYRKGLVLEALKRPGDAADAWRTALAYACPAADAQLILDVSSSLSRAGGSIQEVVPLPPMPATPAMMAASPSVPATSATMAAPPVATKQGMAGACISGATDEVEEVDCVAASTRQRSLSGPSTTSSGASAAAASAKSVQSTSMAVQIAVAQINSGKVDEAEQVLDQILESNSQELGALVARGTARALRRALPEAVRDFSAAIEIEPRYADTWKRRGQARSAMGETDAALVDLQKAIELLPMWGKGKELDISRAECFVEKSIVQQKRRDYRSACKDLQQAVKLDPQNQQAWNMLGLCSTSQGNIADGVTAYQKAVALDPGSKDAWFNMGQALKESGQVEAAEKAFERLLSLDDADSPTLNVYRVMGQMRQQQGRHRQAIALVNTALDHKKSELVVELLFLRAICHHALGEFEEAAADYDKCFTYSGKSPKATEKKMLREETLMFQALSFYQKELVGYLWKNLDRQTSSFCMDADLLPLFKELWCKKAPPTPELLLQYTPQPRPTYSPPPAPPSPAEAAAISKLIKQADSLGIMLQNNHQGFLENLRQRRAAGFAALQLAQTTADVVQAHKAGDTFWVSSQGSSLPDKSSRHPFGWRDAMDILVKWRQLAEPNDQVVWVDLLTRHEFEQGFGSHTPMFSGQTKCVRYYMNFERALELHKQVLLKEGHAMNAHNQPVPLGSPQQQEAIKKARTASDMYQIIQQDSWVVVPIASVSRPGHVMEGTRLTLVKVPQQPDGYEFSIRTPVTPPRWAEFDMELRAAWEGLMQELSKDALDHPALARAILVYAYYWYNFMPLARGTAACGYTTIISLFWAAGMPITARIPKDYQVDWEAILAQHPQQFVDTVSSWMLPDIAKTPGVPVIANGHQSRGQQGGGQEANGRSGTADGGCHIDGELSKHSRGAEKAEEQGDANGGDNREGRNATSTAGKLPPFFLPRFEQLVGTVRQQLSALNS